MTFLEKAHAAVERRLGACSDEVEAWQLDHERAMRVFDCEDLLASMINVFDGIDELNRQYTNDVINGTLTYSEEFDARINTLCDNWFSLANRIKETTLDWCKAQGHDVTKEPEFLEKISLACASKQEGFDSYAIQAANSIRLSIDRLSAVQTPIAHWPD